MEGSVNFAFVAGVESRMEDDYEKNGDPTSYVFIHLMVDFRSRVSLGLYGLLM